jgi:hypothetical protein
MNKKNDQAHRRIVAGGEILRKYGRNNNSPATGQGARRNLRLRRLSGPGPTAIRLPAVGLATELHVFHAFLLRTRTRQAFHLLGLQKVGLKVAVTASFALRVKAQVPTTEQALLQPANVHRGGHLVLDYVDH